MHICMISGGIFPIFPSRVGAIEPYVYGLSRGLAKTNCVDVFGVGHGEITDGNLHIYTLKYLQKFQKSLLGIVDPRIANYSPFNAYVLKKIIELHVKNHIDILHIHEVYTGLAASISKLALGIPYVCTLHNEVRSILPIKTCNRALAVSGYLKNSLIGNGRFTADKLDILNVAVDIDACKSTMSVEQAKKELGLQGKRILLFVGRKCYEKGPQILVNALPKILRQDPDVLTVFIGPDYMWGVSKSEFTKALISLAKKRNVIDNTRFEGEVTNNLKMLYYNAADVFVCPSIWQDPSPTVVKEALSFGKPVVATKVGGTAEIITHGYNGLLVAPKDSDEIAHAVNVLLGDHKYAQKLGSNGRKVVEEKFNFKAVTKDCLKIYHDTLNCS